MFQNVFSKEELALQREARKGMTADEVEFSVESNIENQVFLWSDKYRPRKPRYFNRWAKLFSIVEKAGHGNRISLIALENSCMFSLFLKVVLSLWSDTKTGVRSWEMNLLFVLCRYIQ